MMIGREYSHVFPPKPATRAERRPPVLDCRDLSWTDRLQRHLASTCGRARSSASAASTARASASCCSRCSACCAAVRARSLIDGKPVAHHQPGRAKARRHRHGADPRGPQDRRADAADDGARQSLLRRARPHLAAAASSTAPPSAKLIDEMIKLLGIRTAGTDIPVGALSGGNQQKVVIAKWLMQQPAHHPAQRSDARHRRRHQAGDLPAAAPARRRRRGDPLLLDRL